MLVAVWFTTGVVVFVAGVVAAVILARRTVADPTSSVSVVAAAAAGLFVYGPILLVSVWPVTLIVAVGVGLTFIKRRIRVARWVEIAFAVYGGMFAVVAVTMVLAAR